MTDEPSDPSSWSGASSATNRSPGPPPIPDHELLRCIGRGSYGEVWLARNVMGTHRAIKVVYRQTFEDERPYEREYRGTQQFEPISRSHDGFVDVLQVGRNDASGYFYYVMELGDDATSAQQVDPATYAPKTLGREAATRGRLPFDECLQMGLSLSAALHHLHGHGLIHRDIKPSNIVFVNGIPKIADIGLVVGVGASDSIVGTHGFMPPEGPGSIQADIYSLGKVLYEISTGHDRQSYPELPTQLDAITERKEFLELNEVILKACESNLDRRYRTAGEMHADLVLLQAGRSVRRLRFLEKRLALYGRIAVVTAIGLAVIAALLFVVNREFKMVAERRQQQVGRYVAHGVRLIDDGDYLGALPPLVESLSLDRKDAARQKNHRVRIASVLEQCPKLLQIWFLPAIVNGAELSRDGQSMIVAGSDGTAMLCHLGSDSAAIEWMKNEEELESAGFSPDGRLIVLAGAQFARVHEKDSRRLVHSLAPPGTVYSARFNPEGTLLATASGGEFEGYVWIWDVASGARIAEIAKAGSAFRDASFSPEGGRLVTACEDGTAQVWDLASKRPIGEPIQHQGWVYSASFNLKGDRVVTASFDGTAKVCDAASGRQVLPPLKHRAGVRNAGFSPDGRHVITAGWDHTAWIWSTTTGEAIRPALKHNGLFVLSTSFCPDGRRVVTANANGAICVWDLAPVGWTPAANRFILSPDGTRFALVQGNSIASWPAAEISNRSSFQLEFPPQEILLSRDGSRLLTLVSNLPSSASPPIRARLHDGLTGQPLSPPFDPGTNLDGACLSEDGGRLGTFSGTGAKVWDVATGTLLHHLTHSAPISGGSFSPDARFLAVKCGTEVWIWDAVEGRRLHVMSQTDTISHIEFSPDGQLLVVCSLSRGTLREREAQVWEVATGQRRGSVLHHGDGVMHAAFSPDGLRVVTASEDSSARLWESSTGRPLLPPLRHNNPVTEARFSFDGRWIVTACELDQSARLWDSETGEPLTPPLKFPWQFRHVQFVADGRGIVATRSNGESAFWGLSLDEHPMEALGRLAQLLSGHQWDYTSGVLPQSQEALRDAWQELQAEYPDDFSVTLAEQVAWHLREARAAETAKDWKAALFHWDRILELEPENETHLHQRSLSRDRQRGGQ